LLQFVEYNTEEILCELLWRHFIVFWSVRHALNHISSAKDEINLVECGVCDGLTLRFALESLVSIQENYKAFAYDAWAGMRDDLLRDKEKEYTGNYANISLQNTKNNLKTFVDKIVFIKGYIPESFDLFENPESLIWLHIDLNSSKPTTDALALFYERIPFGGVILFDDYGWHGYTESKQAIDKFLVEKGGSLLPLPTGQAIYFK
ncbi:class I SAM-dependent methyltransferase, partial [bacterium]|nr:class I SAM-dependent methyltransferase [bacterium]